LTNISGFESLATEQTTQSPIDRYESTFVVSPDPSKGDFTTLQDAINALPATGGKIFLKAGLYPITSTIEITVSNVHIQGEGMGITIFTGDSTMTGNTPGLEAHNPTVGTAQPLVADTARGDVTLNLSPTDASSFSAGEYPVA
jgi:Pectinesterase